MQKLYDQGGNWSIPHFRLPRGWTGFFCSHHTAAACRGQWSLGANFVTSFQYFYLFSGSPSPPPTAFFPILTYFSILPHVLRLFSHHFPVAGGNPGPIRLFLQFFFLFLFAIFSCHFFIFFLLNPVIQHDFPVIIQKSSVSIRSPSSWRSNQKIFIEIISLEKSRSFCLQQSVLIFYIKTQI